MPITKWARVRKEKQQNTNKIQNKAVYIVIVIIPLNINNNNNKIAGETEGQMFEMGARRAKKISKTGVTLTL
jgi:hypothetical protein